MSWQRRTCDIPAVRDLTSEEVGSSYVWDLRAVVECGSCKRAGILTPKAKLPEGVKSIVTHAVAEDGTLMDYCVEAEFAPGIPRHITFDRDGKITGEFFPTTSKVTGESN